jgi:hypothetical protein
MFKVMLFNVQRGSLKRLWWVLIYVLFLGAMAFVPGMVFGKSILIFPVLMAAFYFFLALSYWRYVSDPENANFYAPRTHELNDQGLSTSMENGSNSLSKFENFVRVEEWRENFLLFVSKAQFLCIPISAFETSDEARQFFEFFSSKLVKKKIVKGFWRSPLGSVVTWIVLMTLILILLELYQSLHQHG